MLSTGPSPTPRRVRNGLALTPPGDPLPLAGRSLRARAITILVLAVGGLTLLLAVPALRHVLTDIRRMDTLWLLLALALEIASCLSYVVIFRHFFDRLP